MVRHTKILIPFLMLLAACAPPERPSKADSASRLDGAWRLVASEVMTPDGGRILGQPQESFLLFAGDRYSMNWASGETRAPASVEPLRPSDVEKVARFSSLIVNAGRFEISDGVLTIRPDFALVPEYVDGLGEFDYTLTDDTLDLVWRRIESADGTPDPSTAAGVRFHYTWVRR